MNIAVIVILAMLVIAGVIETAVIHELIEQIKMLRLIVHVTESKVTSLQIDINSRGAFRRDYPIDDVRAK